MTFNNYLQADSGWDYRKIWCGIQNSRAELNTLLSYTTTVEDATEKSNYLLKQHVNQIIQQTKINRARRVLNE